MPDGVTIKFVSVNGGVTVDNLECASINIETINGDFIFNRSSCDSIALAMNYGSIYYTGTIDGVNITLETGHGDVKVALERGSDVDVDIQSKYSYTYHPLSTISPGVTMSGTEKTGYSVGKINSKNGNGTMNYRRASPAVSDFSMKNLSIERKFIYRHWFNTHFICQVK